MGLAVLAYPFLRNHAHLETPRREPYLSDDATVARLKAALQLRYRMLPLWYTIYEEYHRLGLPVVRPLFYDFLDDPETHTDHSAVELQLMLGDVVLVHGIAKPMSEQKQAQVYLPKPGGWYDMESGKFFAPGRHTFDVTLDSIPAFYRAGTIVPLKTRIRRSSSCMAFDPLTLAIHLDPATDSATGRVYIDDYKSKNYLDGKSFLSVNFEYKDGILQATKVDGELNDEVETAVERVTIWGLKAAPKTVTLDGVALTFTTSQVDNLHAAKIKVAPSWIELKKGTSWKLKVA